MKSILFLLAFISAYPSNNNYSDWATPYKPYKPKGYLKDLPDTTHIQPDGHNGYYWYEQGDPDSDDILERLPKSHSMTPDGSGGYYVR